eukprot:278506_1
MTSSETIPIPLSIDNKPSPTDSNSSDQCKKCFSKCWAIGKCHNKCGKCCSRYCGNWWLILLYVILIMIIATFTIVTIVLLEEEIKEVVDALECTDIYITNTLCYGGIYIPDEWPSICNRCYYNHSSEYNKKGFINSGTPRYIDINFDCAMREYAYEYGKQLQPRHGSFRHLYDALQINVCNQTLDIHNDIINKYTYYSENNYNQTECIFYVDPNNGSDLYNGTTINYPFLTIQRAINQTRIFKNSDSTQLQCILNLMNGTFYLKSTIMLNEIDSNLIIQNYNGSEVIISGGILLEFEETNHPTTTFTLEPTMEPTFEPTLNPTIELISQKNASNTSWMIYEYEQTKWKKYVNYSNVYGISIIGDHVIHLGKKSSYDDCLAVVQKVSISEIHGPFYSLTYVNNGSGLCYGIRDISWQPVIEVDYISARYIGKNIWYNNILNIDKTKDNMIYGLRVNDKRAVRARYPDQNSEISMQFFAWNGLITYKSQTNHLQFPESKEIFINNTDYPTIEWPLFYPDSNYTNFSGMGDAGPFAIGSGGICNSNYDDIALQIGSYENRSYQMSIH